MPSWVLQLLLNTLMLFVGKTVKRLQRVHVERVKLSLSPGLVGETRCLTHAEHPGLSYTGTWALLLPQANVEACWKLRPLCPEHCAEDEGATSH